MQRTLIHQRVEACHETKNPTMVCRVSSGWVVLGDVQYIKGYTVLLADPIVKSINDLQGNDRRAFLWEMTIIGDVLLPITGAQKINYEILGNSEEALHAHIFPRYSDEPKEYIGKPIWSYPKDLRESVPFDLKRDCSLMRKMKKHLLERGICIE